MFKVKIKILFSLIFFLFVSTNIQSQIFSEDDIKIYNQKISFADKNELSKKPLNEVITEVGKDFIGTEYVAHTLEKDGDEQLVINLSGLDCTTFLETSLTLARCIKKGKTSFKDYQNELTFVRYRDGKIDKYPSRLHYFSDWIYNNQQKEIVKDVTKEIGGEKIKFNLNFMTKNPEFYKQLKENSDFIPIIRKQEKEINNRTYYYIPKAKVESIENKIESGDLILLLHL